MDHASRRRLMAQHLDALEVGRGTYAPPAYRLLWRMGLDVRPPLFSSFASLALTHGLYFGSAYGLAMWVFVWSRQSPPMPVSWTIGLALSAGLLFGLAMAAIYRRKARQLRLPAWEVYEGAGTGKETVA